MAANKLKNAGFENGLLKTFAYWRGWHLHGSEGAVCVYQKKTANPPTGFYQDMGSGRFSSGGNYKFQMKLLSPTAKVVVKPTVWVFKRGQASQSTQETFTLEQGKWQIIQVDVNFSKNKLKKVRAELYWQPTNSEIIIQRAYFGK